MDMITKLREKDLRHGDILSCYSSHLLGRLIRRFSNSHVNHTAMAVQFGARILIVDAQRNGTNVKTVERWLEEYEYEYQIHRYKNPSALWAGQLSNRVLDTIGTTPYDFASLLIWQPWYLLTGRWKGRREDAALDRLYCSEAIGYYHGFPNYWKLSPKAVWEICEASGDYLLIE